MTALGLIPAEAFRFAATRLWWAYLGAALVCGLGLTGLLALLGPENVDPPMPPLDTASGVAAVLSLPLITLFVPALLATFAVTSEYRHGTVGSTFLSVPRRGRVLVAKLVVHAAVGLGYGIILACGIGVALQVGAALHGTSVGVSSGELLGTLGRVAVAASVYALLGVAVGALVRHQVAGVAAVLGYFYLVEPVLMLLPGVNQVYAWLPGGATAGLTRSTWLGEAVAEQTATAGPGVLPAGLALAVLLGYAVAASVLAVRLPLARDAA